MLYCFSEELMKKIVGILCAAAMLVSALTISMAASGGDSMTAKNIVGKKIIIDGNQGTDEGWETAEGYKLDKPYGGLSSSAATPEQSQSTVRFATDGEYLYAFYRTNMYGFGSYPWLWFYVDFPSNGSAAFYHILNSSRGDTSGSYPEGTSSYGKVDRNEWRATVEVRIPIPEADRAAIKTGTLSIKVGVYECFYGWGDPSKGETTQSIGMTLGEGFKKNANATLVLPQVRELDKCSSTGTLENMSYFTSEGQRRNYAISLPEGYNADRYYPLIYNVKGGNALAISDTNIPKNCIAVSLSASEWTAAEQKEFLGVLLKSYPIDEKFVYFLGESNVGEQLAYSFTACLESASKYDTEAAALEWLVAQRYDGYCAELEGITMHAMGDSYFFGSGIGTENSWPSLLAARYHMTHENYGRGSNTIAVYQGYDGSEYYEPMVRRYKDMVDGDADIILLEGGRNDRSKKVPIGKNDSQNENEFKGALNLTIDGLLKKYPSALIVCVTCWNYHDAGSGFYGTTADYAKAMCELVKYRDEERVVCINAANTELSGVDMNSESFRTKYCINSGDISHLNADGMKYVLTRFEAAIGTAYKNYVNGIKNQAVIGDNLSDKNGTDGKKDPFANNNTGKTETETVTETADSGEGLTADTVKSKGCGASTIGCASALGAAVGALPIKRKRKKTK